MHQKESAALPGHDENLQHLMLTLTIFFIFLSIIGIVFLINKVRSIRRKHRNDSVSEAAAHIQNQTKYVNKMKTEVNSSRADMQSSLEREVEELRAFQQEVRRELSTLRTAVALLSERRHGEELRTGDAESQTKGKTE